MLIWRQGQLGAASRIRRKDAMARRRYVSIKEVAARRVSGGLYDEGSPLTYISHKALTGIARIREPKGNV